MINYSFFPLKIQSALFCLALAIYNNILSSRLHTQFSPYVFVCSKVPIVSHDLQMRWKCWTAGTKIYSYEYLKTPGDTSDSRLDWNSHVEAQFYGWIANISRRWKLRRMANFISNSVFIRSLWDEWSRKINNDSSWLGGKTCRQDKPLL